MLIVQEFGKCEWGDMRIKVLKLTKWEQGALDQIGLCKSCISILSSSFQPKADYSWTRLSSMDVTTITAVLCVCISHPSDSCGLHVVIIHLYFSVEVLLSFEVFLLLKPLNIDEFYCFHDCSLHVFNKQCFFLNILPKN